MTSTVGEARVRTARPAPTAAPPVSAPAAARATPRAPRRAGARADEIRALVAERAQVLDAGADHFALLGVARTASAAEIRSRYFALARNLHPDRLAAAGVEDERRDAQRLFSRMNEAFAVLSDPAQRARYVEVLQAGGEAAVKAREAEAEAAALHALEAEERFRLGEMALRRQQLDVAVREFRRAVELRPDEGDHHALLGWALYVAAPDKAQALPVVRQHLQAAIDLKPRSPLPHLYLGRIARMQGERAPAEEHLRQALKLAPDHVEASAELRAVEAMRAPARPSEAGGLFSRLRKP